MKSNVGPQQWYGGGAHSIERAAQWTLTISAHLGYWPDPVCRVLAPVSCHDRSSKARGFASSWDGARCSECDGLQEIERAYVRYLSLRSL